MADVANLVPKAVPARGLHLMLEYDDCNKLAVSSEDTVRRALLEAARSVGATVVGELFFQFRPEGVSGVVLIAESHISIHTWPETGYAAADIYTCGELDPSPGIEIIGRSLGASRCRYATVRRGGAMDSGEARPQGRGVSIDAIADAVVFLGPRGY